MGDKSPGSWRHETGSSLAIPVLENIASHYCQTCKPQCGVVPVLVEDYTSFEIVETVIKKSLSSTVLI